MKHLTREEAKSICDKVMSFSKADECNVQIGGNRTGNIRFARNAVSTSGVVTDTQMAVAVAFGKKQGIATINEFDDKSLEKVVRRAEDLARLAPENPEFMPAVAKQTYKETPTFIQKTADIDPEFLLGAVFDNSQNKLFYRADDIATADFLSDMTGKIQVEDEQKLVTRNSLNSEKLDRETRLIPSERNLYDRNMILKLKLFQAIFCASVPNRSAIASLCKTSPIPAPDDLNGKELVQVNAGNPRMSNKEPKAINSTQNNQTQGKPKTFSEFIERENEHKQRNQSNLTNAVTNHGEHNANSQSSATSDNSSQGHNQEQKTSTSQSDYLF